jgi:hypothetical protein
MLAVDCRWKPVVVVGIHPEIIHIRELSCQYQAADYADSLLNSSQGQLSPFRGEQIIY